MRNTTTQYRVSQRRTGDPEPGRVGRRDRPPKSQEILPRLPMPCHRPRQIPRSRRTPPMIIDTRAVKPTDG
jgi:hypothetical protein